MLENGIVAVWINSARPLGVSVGHGWRPTGRPMLVTRAEGRSSTSSTAHPRSRPSSPSRAGRRSRRPRDLHQVLASPVGLPNARGRYDVRQLHAYLPEGGGINFNTGVSEQSILQVMSTDEDGLIEGARRAAQEAVANSRQRAARARLRLRIASPLLGERLREEVDAISSALDGAPVCGFYTYGEFARTTGSTGVHNSSVAVLAL